MKHLGKLAVLGAVLAASAPFASATPITLTGGLTVNGTGVTQDTFTTTSITFAPPAGGPPTFNSTVAGSTGNLSAPFVPVGTTGTMFSFTSSTTNQIILTLNDAQGLSFKLLNIAVFTDTLTPGFGTSLDIKGTGEFLDTAGDTAAFGTFDLTSADTTCTSTTCTAPDNIGFSFVPAASSVAPEPSSLMLFGTGLVSAAGMLVRRRRIV
jgi:hypothetical protein